MAIPVYKGIKKMKTYIIAEAGVNHNGRFELACQLVDEAKKSGADCVKFQTFKANNVVSSCAEKADYQKISTDASESQLDMIRKLELTFGEFEKLSDYCRSREIQFISTPFDMESIEFLKTLNMPFWKIPSGEITNLPYLIEIGRTRQPIVLSTGMSTMAEISEAIDVLKTNGANTITLLHCTTEYPAPVDEINLRAMMTMRDIFDLPVGYSDHSPGIEVSVAAVALGASILEKHFTLDKSMSGPDHKASLSPNELGMLVRAIRNVERSLGDGVKRVGASESKNRLIARKSIVATKPIRKGEEFTVDNIGTKRPGIGLSPMKWFDVLGHKACREFKVDERIEL